MIVHNVYFWLNDNVTSDEIEAFKNELKALKSIDGVVDLQLGRPAQTLRDIVDKSYSIGLMVVFTDIEAHDRYQADVKHVNFIENNKDKWNKIQIYDIKSD
ncbi:MAG: transcription-repair coupling factor [Planctomycetota bacterium]|nr:MAG: transcription-repair coupling factor [Planctomycetota bacterium]